MRILRLRVLPLAMCLALAVSSLTIVHGGDDELPIDPPTTDSSTTSYGSYDVELDGGSDASVDNWDTTEPYLTTYLTTETPSDPVIQIEMDSTVSLESGEVLSE